MIPTRAYISLYDDLGLYGKSGYGGERIIARLILRVLRGEEREKRKNR